MPLNDYTKIVVRLQESIGKGIADEPWIFNLPGKSVACKIDQYYYLAVMPAFVEKLGRLGGLFPETVTEALVKTGNILTKLPDRDPLIRLTVSWGGTPVTVKAAFVEADFIDRGVKMYSAMGETLSVSDLKISSADRGRVEEFFEEKTPPQALCYY